MNGNNSEYVKGHKRNGKWVKSYIRRGTKSFNRTILGSQDIIDIEEIEETPVITIPNEIFNELQAQVDKPINVLKRYGFNKKQLEELIELKGIRNDGTTLVRNRSNGNTARIKIFDLAPPGVPTPTGLTMFSEEVIG